jgi:hypothetical protein
MMAIAETTNPIPLNKATAKKSFEKNSGEFLRRFFIVAP